MERNDEFDDGFGSTSGARPEPRRNPTQAWFANQERLMRQDFEEARRDDRNEAIAFGLFFFVVLPLVAVATWIFCRSALTR